MIKVIIIGATSAIAGAVARRFVEAGPCEFYLVARHPGRLEAVQCDLIARGGSAACFAMDINHIDSHARMFVDAQARLGVIDVLLIAHGTLPDQAACQADVERTVQEFRTNATSTIALLTLAAQVFEDQKRGTIAVVTSVAGDRGRQSNYVYGAAKAAVDTFLEGLRQRLHKAGVRVVTIRPGFVDTPMTKDIEKGLLWAQPDRVARTIHRAIVAGRDIVYVPFFWRVVMFVIRRIPRPVYKAIRL